MHSRQVCLIFFPSLILNNYVGLELFCSFLYDYPLTTAHLNLVETKRLDIHWLMHEII